MVLRFRPSAEELRAIEVWQTITSIDNKPNEITNLELDDAHIDGLLQDVTNALAGDYDKWVKGLCTGKHYNDINIYPLGVPSGIFDRLLASCMGKITLKEVLDYINEWCGMALKKYPHGHNKHVILVTDKWDENIFAYYSSKFLDFAMRDDFWFTIIFRVHKSWMKIPFLPRAFYKSTRHMPKVVYNSNIKNGNGQMKINTIEDGKIYTVTSLPDDFFFEGIANFKDLPGNKLSVCLFLRGKDNNRYCIINGSCYFAGVEQAVVAIGLWDDKRGIYSALKAGYEPIYSSLLAIALVKIAKYKPQILPIT